MRKENKAMAILINIKDKIDISLFLIANGKILFE